MTGAELADLKSKVRTIQCSNCGAPVDLEHDSACPYCRSPIAILDTDAVAKTVRDSSDAQARRQTIDVNTLADALLAHPPAPQSIGWHVDSGLDLDSRLGIDLVAVGIAAVVAAILR